MTENLYMLAAIVFVYLLPWFIAAWRDHNNRGAIALLNLLLGWTFLGWVVALVWSATDNVKERPA
jgi:hypothetical protein